ncbi:MAG: type II secretion system F family protein [Candidatus Aenigmatarchaeota archaeon]|nr:type II secretion system F family protein [Candidatus Aenigmarchaeota archaeon]
MVSGLWKTFSDLAFRFFGRHLEPQVKHFDSLKPDILKSNLELSLTEYVYVMVLGCLLTFVIAFPVIVVLAALFLHNAILAFLFSFTTSIFITLTVFFIFYTWPAFIANRRRKRIEAALPFAATYMATIAASGAPPQTMFRVLAEFKEYGEISKEVGKISRDVTAFGMDLISAIRKTAGRTPSPEFKELLWGLDTVITTGGNISNYLHEKARLYMEENRRRLQAFSQTLSVLIEIYLTLILVGSIFFVIMTALMSIFGGGANLFISFIQFLIVFVILPVVSVAFIILLKLLAPSD